MTASLRKLSTMQWALVLSLLLHAVILSVRFVDPEGLRRVFESSTLDVILVNAQSDEAPDKAQALAQHNLAGGGEADDPGLMASTPLPPSLQDSAGDSVIDQNQRRIDSMLERQELLLAQVREQLAAMPKPDPERIAADPEAQAQEERRQQLIQLLGTIEKRVQEENARPRKRFLSPATLGTTYAEYYDSMRRQIEAMGTTNFPHVAGRKLYGELLMMLWINHDGSILDARVLRGSGDRMLDRLAEAIAQKAAPFGPFTPAMRKDTDQFDVTALFRFTHDNTLETTLQRQEGSELDSFLEER